MQNSQRQRHPQRQCRASCAANKWNLILSKIFSLLTYSIIIFFSSPSYSSEKRFSEFGIDLFMAPYSVPTQSLSNYFTPDWGGVGFGFDRFWSNQFGIVSNAFFSEQSPPRKPFHNGGDWKTEHYVSLNHVNCNFSFRQVFLSRHLFYPYLGSGIGWLRTNGDKYDTLPRASFGATPILNLGLKYFYFIDIFPFGQSNTQGLGLILEYKQLFFCFFNGQYEGGLFHFSLFWGSH